MRFSFVRSILVFISLLMMTPIVYALTPSSELNALLSSIHSMQADFVQTIYDNRGKAVQQSYGQMAIQRPGKFRWQVTKPIPQLIIANGARLWIYDRDLEQVTIRALHQAAGETPGLLLSHEDRTLDEDYDIKTSQTAAGGLRWFILSPKKPDNTIALVQMGFANNQIQQMKLKDRKSTRLNSSHVK